MDDYIGGLNHGLTATSGSIAVSATDQSTINAQTTGSAIAISGGLGALSVAGAGADATNTIESSVLAGISNSAVTASNAVTVTASASPTINAQIYAIAASAAFGIGGAASLGAAIAETISAAAPATR